MNIKHLSKSTHLGQLMRRLQGSKVSPPGPHRCKKKPMWLPTCTYLNHVFVISLANFKMLESFWGNKCSSPTCNAWGILPNSILKRPSLNLAYMYLHVIPSVVRRDGFILCFGWWFIQFFGHWENLRNPFYIWHPRLPAARKFVVETHTHTGIYKGLLVGGFSPTPLKKKSRQNGNLPPT